MKCHASEIINHFPHLSYTLQISSGLELEKRRRTILLFHSIHNFLWYVTIFIKFTKIINKNQRNCCGIGRIPFLIRILFLLSRHFFHHHFLNPFCDILFISVEWMVILYVYGLIIRDEIVDKEIVSTIFNIKWDEVYVLRMKVIEIRSFLFPPY